MSEANSATIEVATIKDLSQDILSEIFSHFHLPILESHVRRVSRTFHSACDKNKKRLFSLLEDGCIVEVLGCETESLNGQIGCCKGINKDSETNKSSVDIAAFDRFASLSFRFIEEPKFLNPFVSEKRVMMENDRIQGLKSALQEPVDSVYSFVIHNLRIASGLETSTNGDNEDLIDVATTLIPPDASHWSGTQIFNALDEKLVIFSRENLCNHCPVGSNFHPDGPNGEVIRDFVRFMGTWETAKIDLTLYYYARRERAGVVLVGVTQWGLKAVCVAKEPSYMPPGMTRAPPGVMAMAILVPVYDYLVCYHLKELSGFGVVNGLEVVSEHHIREKLVANDVAHSGESASKGRWNVPPA